MKFNSLLTIFLALGFSTAAFAESDSFTSSLTHIQQQEKMEKLQSEKDARIDLREYHSAKIKELTTTIEFAKTLTLNHYNLDKFLAAFGVHEKTYDAALLAALLAGSKYFNSKVAVALTPEQQGFLARLVTKFPKLANNMPYLTYISSFLAAGVTAYSAHDSVRVAVAGALYGKDEAQIAAYIDSAAKQRQYHQLQLVKVATDIVRLDNEMNIYGGESIAELPKTP